HRRHLPPLFTPATSTPTYPLSLHDALPISAAPPPPRSPAADAARHPSPVRETSPAYPGTARGSATRPLRPSPCCNRDSTSRGCRSEEHTSELQSRENLVCRLLLEKKKIDQR